MKHNFLFFLGILAILFPMRINAQEGPKISGFAQGLYQADLNQNGDLASNTLRMRRIRMSIEGKFTKNLSYKIQGDFLNSPMLVDAFLKYKVCDEFSIQAGQFKTPFSIESPINPVNLEIFDYGESIKNLVGYSDFCGVGKLGRDIGIMATGNLFRLEGKDFPLVTYSLGVFNGNGVNVVDNNNCKDIVGRLDIHPMLKALTLSGSYYYGLYKGSNDPSELANGLTNFGHGERTRWAAGLQYNDGDLVVRGEYISGVTGYQAGNINDEGNLIIDEKAMTSNAYYAVAGYNIRFGKDDSQTLMPVLRYEHVAKDIDANNGGTNYYTVGVNYWPLKSVNFKLDYSLIQKESGTNSHRVVGILSYKF